MIESDAKDCRAVERDRCYRDVCGYCADGEPVRRGPSCIWWHTKKDSARLLHCAASPIRERHYEEVLAGESDACAHNLKGYPQDAESKGLTPWEVERSVDGTGYNVFRHRGGSQPFAFYRDYHTTITKCLISFPSREAAQAKADELNGHDMAGSQK